MRAAILATLLLAASSAGAQIFTRAEIEFLVGSGKTDVPGKTPKEGAITRTQIFYHYFKRDRDPSLKIPKWVDQTLEAMLKRPVWKDPDEGVLTEAQLWQMPVSVLYEFFELVRKSLPPSDGGQLTPPGNLVKEYEENRIRFQVAYDRLVRARLGDSLGGRGRAVIAHFDLINKQYDSVMDGLVNGETQRYKDAVIGIGALMNASFETLQSTPRGFKFQQNESGGTQTAAVLFKVVGIGLMFACFWAIGSRNEKKIADGVEGYKVKARDWAHEYERQFIVIKIHYLVGAPVALGLLMGLLTFDPFGLIIFAGFGIYAGLTIPGWLLRNIRFRRGLKCESQLMDAMILMSNGLKSGIDLIGCLEMVQKDCLPPISEEFGLCIKNYRLGTSIERALEGVDERVQSRLLSYMIKAIVIQRSVGGNLTKIFDRIVENIREESKLTEKTAAMTAQQRIQAIVVGIMPWVMLIIMFAFQPGPMKEFYFTGLGVLTLMFCTVWIGIGMKIVNKLGDISV
ncbi:MAG: type II secretion system F family protein [Elusimicrobia bacterium]|nr:type II secretion system F family protein [Elusimicrobiota bacterium]